GNFGGGKEDFHGSLLSAEPVAAQKFRRYNERNAAGVAATARQRRTHCRGFSEPLAFRTKPTRCPYRLILRRIFSFATSCSRGPSAEGARTPRQTDCPAARAEPSRP